MSIGSMFAQELAQEGATTRKYLERVTDDHLAWKPHEKSMTLGRLASHISESLDWGNTTLENDNFSMKTDGSFKPYDGASAEEILKTFDAGLEKLMAGLQSVDDATLAKNWQMIIDGNVAFEMPKMVVIRSWVLNHMIHHRGQLSVYFRENDIPVPATYGPSADEQG